MVLVSESCKVEDGAAHEQLYTAEQGDLGQVVDQTTLDSPEHDNANGSLMLNSFRNGR